MDIKTKFILKTGLFLVLSSITIFISGCQTVQGVGKDIQSLGTPPSDETRTTTVVRTTEYY